jgi:hypothetical protein
MKRLLVACALAGLAAAAPAQEMKPGHWEMSSATTMQGKQMPGAKWTYCFTARDLAEGKQHRMDAAGGKCTVSNLITAGSTFSYHFACSSGGGNMSGEARGSATATGFDTEIRMRMTPDPGMGELTQVITGRRVGDCK